eukprot:223288_1
MTNTQSPYPALDDIAYGFMASQALFAALDLNVFDAIASQTKDSATLESIATSLNIENAERLRILLDSLYKLNIIQYDSTKQVYNNTNDTDKYLCRKSKYFYGDYYRLQISKLLYPRMMQLSKIISTNGPTQEYGYASWFKDEKDADLYSRSQHSGSLGVGYLIHKKGLIDETIRNQSVVRLADIGGGTGGISIGLASKMRNLRATCMDLPNVIKSAKQRVYDELDERLKTQIEYTEGNVLDVERWPFTKNAMNVALLSYLLISIPFKDVSRVLVKARSILKNGGGGQIIVHDFIQTQKDANDTKAKYLTSLWTLQHITMNPGIKMIVFEELRDVLIQCGFTNVRCQNGITGLTMFVTASTNECQSKL